MDTETQPTTAQPGAQQPTAAELYSQALDQLSRTVLALAEQRDVLLDRERAYDSLGAEIDQRRLRIEQDEITAQRLTGAVQALQQLVGGHG